MSSVLQQEANSKNALLSTGPKTPEGKAIAAQNARKHGLSAKHLIIAEDEREEFNHLISSLSEELQPAGTLEQLIFNDLVRAAWDKERCRKLEASLFKESGIDPLLDEPAGKRLDRIMRYQSRADRNFYRSLKELRGLQKSRAGQEPAAETEPTPKLTKRTQLPEPAAPSEPPETRPARVIGQDLPIRKGATQFYKYQL
jgi:hypothetical protein